MSGPPRLPLHVGDYFKDTPPISRVNWEHHGIYLIALMIAWSVPRCRLPNDPEWLSRRFGCTVDEYHEHVEPVLREYFKCDGNFFTQKRLKAEYSYVEKESKNQSARAKSRWKNKKDASRGRHAAEPEKQSGNAPTPTPTPLNNNNGAGAPVRGLDTLVFDQAKALLGDRHGAKVAKDLLAKRTPSDALAAIDTAKNKSDPAAYLHACVRDPPKQSKLAGF